VLLAASLTVASMGVIPPVCPCEQASSSTGVNARRSPRGVMESAFPFNNCADAPLQAVSSKRES
jgi:hypothetical protein